MTPYITAGTRVRCSKLSTENKGDLPDGYWLEGATFSDVETGRPLKIVRSRRARQNPEEPEVVNCVGMFVSSTVKSIESIAAGHIVAKTLNSHWEIKTL